VRGDDLTLALLELRQASARDGSLETQARLARSAARREQRATTVRRWVATTRPAAAGVRVWMRTSWHTLSGHRAGDRRR
jgi:hypothetical protein